MKTNYHSIISLVFISLLGAFQLVNAQGVSTKTVSSNGQGLNYKINWTQNPFDYQVFIENKGQFTGEAGNSDKILYVAQQGKVYVFITNHGIQYKYTSYPEFDSLKGGPAAARSADPDDFKNGMPKHETYFLTANWEGSGNGVTIKAEDEKTDYYTYPVGKHGTIRANAFKKIICQNVYPGIDIEYVFPEGKPGIKYSLIVHPGADLSAVKLKYKGAKNMQIDNDGNVQINCGWGQFTDHAPVSFYQPNHNDVGSEYRLNGDEESFKVNNLDAGKTLVIDPWITNWTYINPITTGGYPGAYDLDYDDLGNVLVYGGFNPWQLVKFNSAGIKQWTYSTNFPNPWYGDFCIDKASGISFALEGFGGGGAAYTDKISSAGTLITQLTTNTLDEQWRATYDLCDHIILIAGGGTSAVLQAATIDTNLLTYHSSNVMGAGTALHDFALIAEDPLLPIGYMGNAQSVAYPGVLDNYLYQMPLPAILPTNYGVPDNYSFVEVGSVTYAGPDIPNGMNGMAVSPNWLYMYDGETLKQLVKNTGALHSSINIGSTRYSWGGLDVDLCDNIYAGNNKNINVYNASLSLTGTIGPLTNAIYDVVLGNGVLSSNDSVLYACGDGFVSSISISLPSIPSIVKVVTPTNCFCAGKCKATLSFCGTLDTVGVTYKWSSGQTTQTATGLCAGVDTITITAGCGVIFKDTVKITGGGSSLLVVRDSTNATCVAPGSASVAIGGGVAPYTYLWSNGSTASSISVGSGHYCVTYSDHTGCKDSLCITVPGNPLPTITITPPFDSLCAGSSGVPLLAAGGVSYTWAPAAGLSCINCPNPTATPLATTIYTVTGTDASGCKNKDSVTIKVNQVPIVSISPLNDTICQGQNVTLNATGGVAYNWQPGNVNGSSITVSPAVTTTYTVTVTDVHGCTATATAIVYFQSPPTITVKSTRTSICSGASVSMVAAAMNTTSPFTWQPGGMTGPVVTVAPTTTTTYTVTASSGCGTASATVTISINPLPDVSFYGDNISGCAPFCVQFRNRTTSADNISQWIWSFGNGDTSSSEYPIYCYQKSGGYGVNLTAISDSGCSSTLSVLNYITVYSKPVAGFTLSPQPTDIMSPTIQFTDNSSDIYGGISYWIWSFGEAGDTVSNLQNPSHVYRDTGEYCPTLIVMNQYSCMDTVTNCLVIDPIFELYIPSAFTPNGDTKNEVFIPKGNDVSSFEMYIFDRWGMQLFHSTSMNNGWNGKVGSGSTISQEGTYVYMITVYDTKGKKHSYVGNVTLIK